MLEPNSRYLLHISFSVSSHFRIQRNAAASIWLRILIFRLKIGNSLSLSQRDENKIDKLLDFSIYFKYDRPNNWRIDIMKINNINKAMIRHKCDLLITVRLNYLISVCVVLVCRSVIKKREKVGWNKMIHHFRELLPLNMDGKNSNRKRKTIFYIISRLLFYYFASIQQWWCVHVD